MAKRKPTKKYYFSVEGETERWYLEWLSDAFVSDEYNVFFPRLSQDQGGFHNYSGKFDSPEGFVEYRNGEFVGVVDGLPNSWEAIIHWAKLHEDNEIDELRDPG